MATNPKHRKSEQSKPITLRFRVTDDEAAKIRADAAGDGLTLSQHMARALGLQDAPTPSAPTPAEPGPTEDEPESESDFIARYVREHRGIPKVTAERKGRSAWKGMQGGP